MPSCDPHAGATAPTFARSSNEWGLDGVTGGRVAVADLDNDGFPDLIVHAGGTNVRGSDAEPRNRILMNRPRDGGGRVFEDFTVESNYGVTRDAAPGEHRSAQLVAAGDVDNDGDVDLFSGTFTDKSKVESPPSSADLDRSEILLNDGSGRFTPAPKLQPHGEVGFPVSGATFADVDRDGNLDLFVVGWYENYGFSYTGTQARLYLGAGDGTFTDAGGLRGLKTDTAGFDTGTNHRPAYGTTSCDVDDDGDMDLLVSAYGRQLNQLYLNDGEGHFRDVAEPAGFAGDLDRDYSNDQFFLCYCAAGGNDPSCPEDPAAEIVIGCPDPANWSPVNSEPWRNNGNTFTTACRDVTGDGIADLYNAEIRHFWAGSSSDASHLLVGQLSTGEIRYQCPDRDEHGLSWAHPDAPSWNEGGISAAIVDLDLDARPDLLVGASDYPEQYALVFQQQPDGTFKELGRSEWGLHHPCAPGLAVADFDRDGDLDVVLTSSRARDCAEIWDTNAVHLYENVGAPSVHWLAVDLKGSTANAGGVGARVTVIAGGKRFVQERQSSYGHFGLQNDSQLLFGVGDCSEVDLEVRWPDGSLTTQVLEALETDQRVLVEQ